jgi:hypothetical protein
VNERLRRERSRFSGTISPVAYATSDRTLFFLFEIAIKNLHNPAQWVVRPDAQAISGGDGPGVDKERNVPGRSLSGRDPAQKKFAQYALRMIRRSG